MGSDQNGGTTKVRTKSQFAQNRGQENRQSHADIGGHHGNQAVEDGQNAWLQHRVDASPSRLSLSSSLNQRTPARSYFQHPYQESIHGPVDISRSASQGVREDTAELASLALSDISFHHGAHSPLSRHISSSSFRKSSVFLREPSGNDRSACQASSNSTRPNLIEEDSQPTSPHNSFSSQDSRCQSALTEILKCSPPTEEESRDTDDDEPSGKVGVQHVTVCEAILSQPNERTGLLREQLVYGSMKDVESQQAAYQVQTSRIVDVLCQGSRGFAGIGRAAISSDIWSRENVWKYGVLRTTKVMPAVLLGLLLNILDALSYGLILFPLGDSLFADLGSDGVAMFYVSCIMSQLVFSLGGSGFKGAVGSEMIEVVPFFHKMAFTIIEHIGRDQANAKERIRATVIAAFSISTLLTGVVFFGLGKFRLGELIGFFPRHILLGCVGGVGFFLVQTGLEVSARLPGSLQWDATTLHRIVEPGTLLLWTIPLVLALLLYVVKHWIRRQATDAIYFTSIIAVFWFFVLAIPALKVPVLRQKGWIFEEPEAGKPWYHFYTLYSAKHMDWSALERCIPAMLALTFFAILHVPINIPALGMNLEEDIIDLDRELTAHGYSNFLSGLFGSVQNYLVFANTTLFIRSGGDDRVAGVMLAAATFIVMALGQTILGFIPVMVVGALIFFIGFELLKDGLVSPWGKTNRLEYLTIIIIVITMGAWDFVYGIIVGILLACVSFVLQTSQVSAIRGKLYGGDANSTVRRHAVQHRFLEQAGRQIYVMKLAGFLFFGTIVDVEKHIRAIVDESFRQGEPIRYLVIDLFNVDGVDFSASETFARIHRLSSKRDIQLVICGVSRLDGKVGKSLRSTGLLDKDDGIQYFTSLNVALEFCENQLLRSLRHQQQCKAESESTTPFLEVPKAEHAVASLSPTAVHNSPRTSHLQRVAINTLREQNPVPPFRWQDHRQPLQLILQTFSTVSDQADKFWYRTASSFIRKEYCAGSVLYQSGDKADGFYLLESGLLKAKYDFPQGRYSELIVAGTTCGELPFFSATNRTANTLAVTDCVTWMLDEKHWQTLQVEQPVVAQELLKISLKLTKERMDAVTKYMLLTSG